LDTLFGLEMTTIAAVLGVALAIILCVLAFLAWRSNVMFKLGLRPILRRRTQSGLIVVGLMLATLIITAAFVTGDTLSHTIRSLVVEELGPVDEVVGLRANAGAAARGSEYFSLSRFEDLAGQLSEDPLIDAAVPVIRESIAVVNTTSRQSIRSLSIIGLRPEDASLIIPIEELTDADGNRMLLEALAGRDIFLNQAAAESLAAQAGDELELYVGSSPKNFTVAGVAASGRSARAFLDLAQMQSLFSQRGRINAVMVSNLGDQVKGARHSEQVTARIRGLLSDEFATRRLFSWLISDPESATVLRNAAITYDGNTRADLFKLAAGLESGLLDEDIRSLLADEELGAEVVAILEQAGWGTTASRKRLETQFSQLSEFSVDDYKRDGLDSAELAANAFTTIFVVTGLFGIASGLLLIFLIFVMLAAERKSEMGMTRAIGAQRSHLVQMFVFEGTAYDLVAAAVGVALGVITGLVIAFTLGRAFAETDIVIRPYFKLTSLAVSYALGMLVTFITVLISANRVSRLNIVAAIRDLPEQPARPMPMKARLLAPFTALLDGLRALLRLRLFQSVKSCLIGIPLAILRIIWAGFRSGLLTFLLGVLLVPASLNAGSGTLFTMGMSFAVIGAGILLRGILTRIFPQHRVQAERIAFTLLGLSLTIFWSLPSSTFELIGVKDLKSGPEMLFIAGLMLVVGAVMVVMYNTDLLLRALLRLLGGQRQLAPVLRMAVAYPLANRFRTGLTLGMFGVVVFSVVFMATAFKTNEVFFANTEALTGGFQLRARASASNPIPNLARSAAVDPQLRTEGYEVVASEYSVYAELQQEGNNWEWYPVRGMDEAYLETVGYDFALKAVGYQDASEVWQMIKERPGYAVVDSYPVPSRQTTSIIVGGPEFKLSGLYLEDEVMDPIRLRVREPGGASFEVTVIGVVEVAAFMNPGVITSQTTLENALPDPPAPTTYYIRLAEGADAGQAGAALESAFMEYGLETVDQVKEIEDAQASQRVIEQLLLGFLTLGLIVGVAALGVISSRAVVERRQQIGVLRALGFQARMVTWSFMVEASFVALLGIGLGAVLALIPASQMINDMSAQVPGLYFQVPWGSIALVVGLAYGMALVATYFPAQQAARVMPAEALRYE
jgi:putative ABC transport system permease protein